MPELTIKKQSGTPPKSTSNFPQKYKKLISTTNSLRIEEMGK